MKQSILSEQQLITRLQEKNQEAFLYLYNHYSSALYGLITDSIPDEELATDVLQQAFTEFWQQIDRFEPGTCRLFTWMMRIVHRKTMEAVFAKEQENMANGIGNNASVTNLYSPPKGFRKLLSQLDDEQRFFLELFYYGGYTFEQVAAMQNIPVATVKEKLNTALRQFKACLSQIDDIAQDNC